MNEFDKNCEIDRLIEEVKKQEAVLYMTDVALSENENVVDTQSIVIILESAWQKLGEISVRLSGLLPENYNE